jgi:hypothetical protein
MTVAAITIPIGLLRFNYSLPSGPVTAIYLILLRKFAEQYGNIIGWDQSNRAYIMTQGVRVVGLSLFGEQV